MRDSKEKINELYAVKRAIESKEFQFYVMKPLLEELKDMPKLKKYKNWEEVLKAQGREEGLLKLIDIFKRIDLDIKNTRHDLESQPE